MVSFSSIDPKLPFAADVDRTAEEEESSCGGFFGSADDERSGNSGGSRRSGHMEELSSARCCRTKEDRALSNEAALSDGGVATIGDGSSGPGVVRQSGGSRQ